MKKIALMLVLCVTTSILFSQNPVKDSLVFKTAKPGLYQEVQKDGKPLTLPSIKRNMAVDLTGKVFPTDTNRYQKAWCQPPVCQGESGTCWCFAATSFIEAECYRLTGKKIKLAEMYFVYNEYADRALEFVNSRGAITFDEGSESSSVPLLIKKYGAIPLQAYPGKPAKYKYHHHREMVAEMKAFLNNVKETQNWNPQFVESGVKAILDFYMGAPPAQFSFESRSFTPATFATEILKTVPFDYFSFMSNTEQAQNQHAELIEDDNWRHFDEYYNVNLNDFVLVLTNALNNGYTACICGDISEPGFDREQGVAVIPTWDIPSAYIDENARQFRLINKTTTDDHCMHIVGFTWQEGKYWFLTKDSNAGAFDGPVKGYRFISEDFVRLKMMNIMVHKQAGKPVLDKIIK